MKIEQKDIELADRVRKHVTERISTEVAMHTLMELNINPDTPQYRAILDEAQNTPIEKIPKLITRVTGVNVDVARAHTHDPHYINKATEFIQAEIDGIKKASLIASYFGTLDRSITPKGSLLVVNSQVYNSEEKTKLQDELDFRKPAFAMGTDDINYFLDRMSPDILIDESSGAFYNVLENSENAQKIPTIIRVRRAISNHYPDENSTAIEATKARMQQYSDSRSNQPFRIRMAIDREVGCQESQEYGQAWQDHTFDIIRSLSGAADLRRTIEDEMRNIYSPLFSVLVPYHFELTQK